MIIITLLILYLKAHLRKKKEPKQVIYLNYKHFQWQHFENDLESSLNNCNGNFDEYEKTFTNVLNSHAPKKVKVLRGNLKPYLNKKLRKTIMERSRLKNKANKSNNLLILLLIKNNEIWSFH